MKEIILVGQLIAYVFLAGLLFWSSRYFYKLYVNKRHLNKIRQLQSRISVLKLMLRSRLKKNCNSLANIFQGEKVLVAMFQAKYGNLAQLDLGRSEHYQTIIAHLKEISDECARFFAKKYSALSSSQAIRNEMKLKEENRDEAVVQIENLIKFEFPALLMIKEIVESNNVVRAVVEQYNDMQKNKKDTIKVPDELKIELQELLFPMLEEEYTKSKADKIAVAFEAPSDLEPELDSKAS